MPTANIFFDVKSPTEKIISILSNEHCFSDNTNNIDSIPDIINLIGDTSIGVDAVRAIGKKISIPPNMLSHKYIVCKNCHLLTEAAQNALLKHLEQNYNYIKWLFFTESKYEYKLLKTLRSRFILIYDTCEDEFNQEVINEYILSIKRNHFDIKSLDLDCLLRALFKLYEDESIYRHKTHWLKKIERVIAIKSFQQSHLKWSKTTTLAMIFSN